MSWEKQGHIYAPDGSFWWAKSYAHLPTVLLLDDVVRVYYAGLDENKYGRIGFVDLNPHNLNEIVYVHPEPTLDLGMLGTFDSCGTVPSCVIQHEDTFYLYYIGFQRAERVPYMLFTGVATSSDGVHFERYSHTPILDRTPNEPFSRSAPHIIEVDGIWRMWYWSCTHWTKQGDLVHYNNVIRHAQSTDGINWQVSPSICIEPSFPDEYAAGRPWVVMTENGFKMWYSIRSHSYGYRFGYAESNDGLTWQRLDDQAGLIPSLTGWDSEMVCYPSIANINDELILFYNGNRHGQTGFGYAIWKDN
ncbi:MAG: hypothetical protein AAFR81_00585 [Chloroflexota bacterium]